MAPRHEKSKVQHILCWKVAMVGKEGVGVILTDTTRSHVSGNHDGALVGLELVENPVTLVLLLITMNG
jgi:hypothetical protein